MKKITFLSAFFFCCFILQSNAQSQLKHWFFNSKAVDFSQSTPQVSNLPISNPFIAEGATNAMYDAEGNMLFMVRDSRVLDKDFNLIESLVENETFQLLNSEIEIVPIPGTCKYYIVYFAHYAPNEGSVDDASVYYSEFDLSLNNGNGGITPGKKDISLVDFFAAPLGNIAVGQLKSDGTRALYIVTSDGGSSYVYKSTISETEISTPTLILTGEDREFANVELELSPDESKLAFGAYKIDGPTVDGEVFIIHLDANGDLDVSMGNDGLTILDLPSSVSNIKCSGVEFSQDNQFLFVGAIDIGIFRVTLNNLQTITFLDGSQNYSSSQIERAYNGLMYVASSASTLGSFDPTDSNPIINEEIDFTSDEMTESRLAELWGGGIVFYTLPDQLDGFDYDNIFSDSDPSCCSILAGYDINALSVSTSDNWNGSNNPFGASVIRISDEIRIQDDVVLNITDMTLEFGENGRFIVEAGGKVVFNSSLLTGVNCGINWEGIEVWGDPNENQYGSHPGSNAQGKVEFKNSTTVEHARTAVKAYNSANPASTTGGIIIGRNSTFRNNTIGIELQEYHNTILGTPANNLSSFRDCIFTIDDEYLSENNFLHHVSLFDVEGIIFSACEFENISSFSNNAQAHGIGINSLDSRFIVTGKCLSPTFPCTSYKPSKFDGLFRGVSATNSFSEQPYRILRSEFVNNSIGIFNQSVNGAFISRNSFDVGGFAPGGFIHTGITINNSTDYYVRNNEFTGNGIGSGSSFPKTLGVVVQNSGGHPNLIKDNYFTQLFAGNYAFGVNRTLDENATSLGLMYQCNENENNALYDFLVYGEGIALYQGDATFGAGNEFSHTGVIPTSDFNNNGTNAIGDDWPVNYYYNPSNTPEEPIFTNNVWTMTSGERNCNPGVDVREKELSLSDKMNLEIKYLNSMETYNSLNAVRNSLVNGGSTEDLIVDVQSSWPDETWALRNKLLGDSPHVTEEVLKIAADKTEVLPHTILYEILAANPDELRKESLVKHLKEKSNPLPSYLIDLLLTSYAKNPTARTALEADISKNAFDKQDAANALIHDIHMFTPEEGLEAVRTWLINKESFTSDLAIVNTYLSDKKLGAASQLLNNIPQLYTLDEHQLSVYDEFKDVKSLQMSVFQSGRSMLDLTPSEINTLSGIADNAVGIGGAEAQSLLNFAYGYNYFQDYIFPPIGQNRILYTEDNIEVSTKLIEVFPNPAKDWASIKYNASEVHENTMIEILDRDGTVVKVFNCTNNSGIINYDTSELPAGIYICQLMDGNVIMEQQKLIVMK